MECINRLDRRLVVVCVFGGNAFDSADSWCAVPLCTRLGTSSFQDVHYLDARHVLLYVHASYFTNFLDRLDDVVWVISLLAGIADITRYLRTN